MLHRIHGLVATPFPLLQRTWLADMGMQQNGSIGVCLYIGQTNFMFLPTLRELDCHQFSFIRGSDTSACPSKRLGPIGGLCQVLDVRKYSVGSRIIIRKHETG